jgi:hypothetical protein
MSDKTGLYKKLVEVLGAVSKVKKSGYNSYQKYAYIMEADLLDVLREELIKRNVFIFTSSKVTDVKELRKNDKPSFITTVTTTHTFVDGDTGESFAVDSVGQGYDDLDKGIFKAITGANKYFLLKNFLMSAGDDPEDDGVQKPKAEVVKNNNFPTTQEVTATQVGDKIVSVPKKETPKGFGSKPAVATATEQKVAKPQGFSKPASTEPKSTFGKSNVKPVTPPSPEPDSEEASDGDVPF